MIPLCLITGFLGSGKTTLLKRLAKRFAQERVVFLVNEFSSVDVDGELLQEIGPDTVSIPGGSIFCRCLVTDFIRHLTAIPEQHHSEDAPLQGVIIEASGIADPRVVNDMLAETKLDRVYELRNVVCVADPKSLRKLLKTLPNMRAQLEAADVVLVNKTDLHDEASIAATEAAVREVRPDATLIRTVECDAEIDPFAPAPARRELHGEYAKCVDPNYDRFALVFEGEQNLESLTARLEELGDELYRAKGFVPTPDGLVYLDVSTAGIRTTPAKGSPAPGFGIIVRGGDHPRAKALADAIKAGELKV